MISHLKDHDWPCKMLSLFRILKLCRHVFGRSGPHSSFHPRPRKRGNKRKQFYFCLLNQKIK